MEQVLVIHIPVIHRGYIDFLNRRKNLSVFLFSDEYLSKLASFKPDIASINPENAKTFLENFGFKNISILNENNLEDLRAASAKSYGEPKEIILINDEISRNFAQTYLKDNKIIWELVFLRWDKSKVLAQEKLEDIAVSSDDFDIKMMKEAYSQSEKTGDWWRQIGAVLVKNGEILIRAYNQDVPGDHTPYQVGEVRDLFNPGERSDLASTIHAEQRIIAEAAKSGTSISGLSMYVTTFPCPVCAKLIAASGIKNLYFSEGWSNFDSKKVLESAGVKIICVPLT